MRTPNLLLPSLLVLVSAFGLQASTSAVAADPVYKWKDSSGQSHYAQSPPVGQKYQTITPVSVTTTEAPAPAVSTPPVPPSGRAAARTAQEQKNCATARSNAALLASHPDADIDASGAGKPAPVTSAQRAAEIARANQQVQLHCGQ